MGLAKSTGLLLAIEHKTADVDTAFAEFNATVNYFVEKYIPSRTVCIKPKDPAFITRQLNITYVNETLPCVQGWLKKELL